MWCVSLCVCLNSYLAALLIFPRMTHFYWNNFGNGRDLANQVGEFLILPTWILISKGNVLCKCTALLLKVWSLCLCKWSCCETQLQIRRLTYMTMEAFTHTHTHTKLPSSNIGALMLKKKNKNNLYFSVMPLTRLFLGFKTSILINDFPPLSF